jgi:hypothetical protein
VLQWQALKRLVGLAISRADLTTMRRDGLCMLVRSGDQRVEARIMTISARGSQRQPRGTKPKQRACEQNSSDSPERKSGTSAGSRNSSYETQTSPVSAWDDPWPAPATLMTIRPTALVSPEFT